MTDALSYFSAKLAHETDASDVYAAQKDGEPFTLVDVRSDEAWAQGRIAGAIHMRRQDIAERAPQELDPRVPVVVYCWSPGCNAATRQRWNSLGSVLREGDDRRLRVLGTRGPADRERRGPLPRTFDAQVMVVRAACRLTRPHAIGGHRVVERPCLIVSARSMPR